jgi:hypothetical protein
LIGVLLLGIADSMSGPYLVLFGADRAHLAPFAIGVFVLDREAEGASARGTPALRSVFSLAWAMGPMVGAAVLAWQGFTVLPA